MTNKEFHINPFDDTYLDLLKRTRSEGVRKTTRNGVTLSVFGVQAKFDLTRGFPLLTTKKMAWRSIVTELLWFISGSSNVRPLMLAGNPIWDANAYDFYTKSVATPLPFEEWKDKIIEDGDFAIHAGDMGPVYGSQWRRWPTPYGYLDQLGAAIDQLRTTPDSRDIIVSAWNPALVGRQTIALPPCHILFQFYTRPIPNSESRYLDCQMYQRSCDLFLGVPFNIASYALLMRLVAATVGMTPGTFTHTYGDLHIYENHLDQVTEQQGRVPFAPPHVTIHPRASIDDYTPGDIMLVNYESHPPIKALMAV